MSILIKGAKMPKSCAECDFIVYDDEYEFECWCPIIRSNVDEYTADKPASCPLVEVPPHGRLIDVDKLPLCMVDFDDRPSFRCVFDIDIEAAPTVIEAEGARE